MLFQQSPSRLIYLAGDWPDRRPNTIFPIILSVCFGLFGAVESASSMHVGQLRFHSGGSDCSGCKHTTHLLTPCLRSYLLLYNATFLSTIWWFHMWRNEGKLKIRYICVSKSFVRKSILNACYLVQPSQGEAFLFLSLSWIFGDFF